MFKCIIPMVPFLCDFPDYLQFPFWPATEILPALESQGISLEEGLKVLSYFDVKNFTSAIKCPTLMCFGLQDETCPPHTNFGGYNPISSTQKFYSCYPFSGHAIYNEQPRLDNEIKSFLQKYRENK